MLGAADVCMTDGYKVCLADLLVCLNGWQSRTSAAHNICATRNIVGWGLAPNLDANGIHKLFDYRGQVEAPD